MEDFLSTWMVAPSDGSKGPEWDYVEDTDGLTPSVTQSESDGDPPRTKPRNHGNNIVLASVKPVKAVVLKDFHSVWSPGTAYRMNQSHVQEVEMYSRVDSKFITEVK